MEKISGKMLAKPRPVSTMPAKVTARAPVNTQRMPATESHRGRDQELPRGHPLQDHRAGEAADRMGRKKRAQLTHRPKPVMPNLSLRSKGTPELKQTSAPT